MTVGGGTAASMRFKIFVLLAGPLLVALATGLGGVSSFSFLSAPADADLRSRRLEGFVERLLDDTSRIAHLALEDSPAAAREAARLLPGDMVRRLEGVGIIGPDLEFVSWIGMPAPPPPSLPETEGPAWVVRVEGARTRLVVRAGPDKTGNQAVASFVIDSVLGDLGFGRILPPAVSRGLDVDVTFLDTESARGEVADPASVLESTELEKAALLDGRIVTLRSPAGDVLAVATLLPVPPDYRAQQLRQQGRAWALILFLVLLAALFRWKSSCRDWRGAAVVSGVLVLARLALAWQDVPARLLPRELGAPSLYGSSGLLGLLASPADLLLTAGALYLLCLAVREGCAARDGTPVAMTVATLTAVGATLASHGMNVSVARNSRVQLLAAPAPFEWDTRLLLWSGLLLSLLGAAVLWGWLWMSWRSRSSSARHGTRLLPVAVALVVLVVGSNGLMQVLSDRLALEQLRSEYAPQVLEQSARRHIALISAMNEISEAFATGSDRRHLAGSRPEYLAYHYWVTGELFHSRYKSSLDFYTPAGDPISHFAFDLPPLDESINAYDAPPATVLVKEEAIEGDVVQRRLLHAELPVFSGDELLGVVVGHVLNEPEDLPFLPWSQPYLAALGPGLPRLVEEAPEGGLNYVLYAPNGAVRLTTLLQPPAGTEDLREAARTDSTIRVVAGDEPFRALALEESGGRLHLLLLPQRTVSERLGTAVRFSLLGLLLLALLALGARVFRKGGLRSLVHQLRISFYRKLLATVLVASVVPLIGLALFLRGYVDRRGDAELIASATHFVSTAQRVVEDYSAQSAGEEELELNDAILHWLRRVVGQEIHLYERGSLLASSKRELFDSGLLPPRLDGDVQRRLLEEGLPYLVAPTRLGPGTIPVAYAPVRRPGEPAGELVVAVPLVLEQRQIERDVSRLAELILLATVALAGLLAVAAALLARTVARPVRELVDATGQIAAGDYATRLEPRTEDEVAELVHGFNTMAAALAGQRRDLERRRDYIETLLRHATTGVVSLDTEGRIVTLNPAAAHLLASSAAQLGEGAGLQEALEESDEFEPLARALYSGSARSGEPVNVDLVRDGEPRRFRAVRVKLTRAGGKGFGTLILLDDVTDLMRSNRLAAWAEMARAIAHEIKNPLTPIQLSAEHLERLLRDRKIPPSSEENACLDTIVKQVRALYDIAGEFSSYAKLPVLAPEPTDPVEFMRRTVAPYVSSKPRGVTIEERYDPAPPIAVDSRVLARAIVNLVENALQAMDAGGRLTISVNHDPDEDEVVLSVADTGHGLGPEVRSRLFEPYFSTKSSGTGLGLAISRRAVEAHGGSIEVSSESGRGTTFRVRIPALQTADGAEPASD